MLHLLLKGRDLALELRDVGTVTGVGFFQRVDFGAKFAAGDAGDFGLQEGSEIGHFRSAIAGYFIKILSSMIDGNTPLLDL